MSSRFAITAALGIGLLGSAAALAQQPEQPPPAEQQPAAVGPDQTGAQIEVRQAEPQVSIVQDQPNVQFERVGEPEIEVQTVPTAAGLPAEMLVGWTARSADGNDLGEVRDLLLAPDGSRIDSAIVARSGWLGLRQNLVQVPWTEVQEVNRQDEALALALTGDQFGDLPEFEYPEGVHAVVGPENN